MGTKNLIRWAMGLSLLWGSCLLPFETLGQAEAAEPSHRSVFFDPAADWHLTLTLTEAEWARLTQDMKDQKAAFGDERTGRLRQASLAWTGTPASGIPQAGTFGPVGLRTRGNTTRVRPEDGGVIRQAHFQLDFGEKRFFGLSSLALKCPMGAEADDKGYDPNLVREVWCYQVLQAAGVLAPRAVLGTLAFVLTDEKGQVTRNLYFGPYAFIEPVNKSFLKDRWGSDLAEGDLYKALWQQGGPATLQNPGTGGWARPEVLGSEDWTRGYHPSYDLNTNQDTSDHSTLKAWVSDLNKTRDADFAAWAGTRLEVDRFLRWMAVNALVGMPDDYRAMGNNFYLYFPSAGGRAEFIPYDYDHSLGAGWMPFDTAAADPFAWPNLNRQFGVSGAAHPLADRILAVPAWKRQLAAYLKEFTAPGGLFSRDAFVACFEAARHRLERPRDGRGHTWVQGIAAASDGSTRDLVPGVTGAVEGYFERRLETLNLFLP